MVVISVVHRGAPKMVGKIIRVLGKAIFFHSSTPSQRHVVTSSPGGVDLVVLQYLKQNGINEVHHYIRGDGRLYVASVDDLLSEKAEVGVFDGRRRAFLPIDYWEVHDELPYVVPYVRQTVVLHDSAAELDGARRVQRGMP